MGQEDTRLEVPFTGAPGLWCCHGQAARGHIYQGNECADYTQGLIRTMYLMKYNVQP